MFQSIFKESDEASRNVQKNTEGFVAFIEKDVIKPLENEQAAYEKAMNHSIEELHKQRKKIIGTKVIQTKYQLIFNNSSVGAEMPPSKQLDA